MRVIPMKDFKFHKVSSDFDSSDDFAYRVFATQAWESGSGLQVLNNICRYLDADTKLNLYTEYFQVFGIDEEIFPMQEFSRVLGNDFQSIYPRIGDFALDDDYFYIDAAGYIYSGTLEDALADTVPWQDVAKAVIDGKLSKNIYDLAKLA